MIALKTKFIIAAFAALITITLFKSGRNFIKLKIAPNQLDTCFQVDAQIQQPDEKQLPVKPRPEKNYQNETSSCGPTKSTSKWFCCLYNPSTRTQWLKSDPEISTKSRERMKGNGGNFDKARFQLETTKLFKYASCPDYFQEIRQKNGRVTCSVVGNSDNLLQSSYGSIIDSSDIVFRINRAWLDGYEKDVGSKTTFQSLYASNKEEYRKPNSILVTLAFYNEILFATYAAQHLSKNVFVVHPEFYLSVTETWLKEVRRPTSGMIILLLAIHLCDEVSAFGYGQNQGKYRHYYYNNEGTYHGNPPAKGGHNVAKEADLRLKLAEENVIKLYPGSSN